MGFPGAKTGPTGHFSCNSTAERRTMGRGPHNIRQTRTLRASEKTMGTAAAILLRKSYLCAGKSSMDGEVTKPLLVTPNIYILCIYRCSIDVPRVTKPAGTSQMEATNMQRGVLGRYERCVRRCAVRWRMFIREAGGARSVTTCHCFSSNISGKLSGNHPFYNQYI